MGVMDTRLLVHIGIELVVVSGISFWLNRKINTTDARVEALEERMLKYENLLSRLLPSHEMVLAEVFPRGPGGTLQKSEPQRTPPGNGPAPPPPVRTDQVSKPPSVPGTITPPGEPEDHTNEDLDLELGDIFEESIENKEPDAIEIDTYSEVPETGTLKGVSGKDTRGVGKKKTPPLV